LRVAHVRRAQQPAVQAIGPAVVRTLDRAGQPARRLLAKPRAAVAADVEERVKTVPLAHHDQALARHLRQEVVARPRQLLRPAHADPAPREDALRFFRVERLGGVVGPGERPHLAGEGVAAVAERFAPRVVSLRSTRPGRWPLAAPASYTTPPLTHTRWMPADRAW